MGRHAKSFWRLKKKADLVPPGFEGMGGHWSYGRFIFFL
jgi:hypothetical protein